MNHDHSHHNSQPTEGRALDPVTPEQVSEPVVEGATYVCPMHPEIVRDAPGSCPICGMALEPRSVTVAETNPELADMTRRLRVSLLFTAPILAFMVAEFLPGQPLDRLVPSARHWIEFALAAPVVLWGGWPFFV